MKNIKGQIFPFMLAVLAIFLVIAMMVVNLGKVAVFRTDTSNAADAGALAGASSLSQGLLGIGLRNDRFAAQTAVNTGLMINRMVNDYGPYDLINYFAEYVSQVYAAIGEYKRLMYQEGVTTWASAKRAALQFAFQNSGVDQPANVSYKEYKVEKKKPGDYSQYRQDLLNDETMQSGFSRFMNDPGLFGGPIGAIIPSIDMSVPDYEVASEYNWSGRKLDQTTPGYGGGSNYVKVIVRGNQYYSIWMLSFKQYFGDDLVNYVTNIAIRALNNKYSSPFSMCGYGPWWKGVCITAVTNQIPIMPASFSLDDPETSVDEEKMQTNDNYITIKTQRFRDNDLGMWKFDYKDIISRSQARTYKEEEALLTGNTSNSIFIKEKVRKIVTGSAVNGTYQKDWFDDQDRHLFETELTDVR